MHKVIIFIFLISIFLQADKIVLVADEWCPYNCEASGKKQGYMVDLAHAIFDKKGHTVEYKSGMSWNDAIINTRDGVYTGIIGAYKTDAPDFIFHAEPLGVAGISFLLKKDNPWKYTGIKSLHNLVIGHIKGYSYGEELDKYINENITNPEIIQLVSGDRVILYNAKKLLYEKIDILIENSNVLNYYFHEDIENGLYKIEPGLKAMPIYIAFSPNNKNSKEYAKILSEGIIKLRKSGELQKILNKYGLKDWSKAN